MEGHAIALRQLLTADGYRVYADHTNVPHGLPARRAIGSDEPVNYDAIMKSLLVTFPAVAHDTLHCVVDASEDGKFVHLVVYAVQ